MTTAGLVLVGIGIGVMVLTLRYVASQGPLDARDRDEVHIVLTDDGFKPREVRVKKDAVIIFSTTRNGPFWPASNSHPVHELYPEFDPDRPIEPNETWSFTADKPGTWGFHDHIRAYYRGILYVE